MVATAEEWPRDCFETQIKWLRPAGKSRNNSPWL
jgi:hypothetical protein